jgi:cytochrome c oxidase cbb3-type subunit 3
MTHPRQAFSATRIAGASAMLFCALALVARVASQEQKSPHATKDARHVAPSATDGRQAFETRCAGCHGLDGRGGERGPDIATGAQTQGREDNELFQIVDKGRPETGMPSFGSLGHTGIANVISYLRLLQGRSGAEKLPGDAQKGRGLFYGKAGCAECHMVGGAGGFIAGDLSAFGGTRSAEEIRSAITKPSKVSRLSGTMIVTTRDGRQYSGVVRNEDNFSLQMQTLDGEFHLFQKSDLDNSARQPEPLMPSDYGSTLSAGELNDLVSFLMFAGNERKAGTASRKKSRPDDEDE